MFNLSNNQSQATLFSFIISVPVLFAILIVIVALSLIPVYLPEKSVTLSSNTRQSNEITVYLNTGIPVTARRKRQAAASPSIRNCIGCQIPPFNLSPIEKKNSMDVSEFYRACQDGDIPLVEWLLPSFSLADVDRIEPNGSTALHAASSNGHPEVIRLLLEKGASRQQLNIFNITPANVAKTSEIKQLFHRPTNTANNRFVADAPATEWMLTDWKSTTFLNHIIHPFADKESLDSLSEKIATSNILCDAAGMVQSTYLLQEATKKKDATYLLKAYTAQTDFYRLLNVLLANHVLDESHGSYNISYTELNNKPWYLAFVKYIFGNAALASYHCTGTGYRGMYVTNDDLDQYKVGEKIINKACLSTSVLRSIAERFIARTPSTGKRRAICMYEVKDHHNAMDLQSVPNFLEKRKS
ncbi:unnamed protein product [Rotaria magnacalcarata]|uniref:Uncharacterized protein n=2 Tax=Rotaria magnacalcarata TaxID=392030 RepID=A0A8S2MTK3_9BILA|nr:unnamed protein product [Rotaria magnacalcarata]